MNKPKSLMDTNEGTTVSNSSPQSPTGRDLLDSITLDFDPMSFEFRELTSPTDSNPGIDETLSPSQNVDVVDFFDPFCPVKEESPTDYYPNVMLGQNILDEPLIDDFSAFNETVNDNLQDDLSHLPQFSNTMMNHHLQEDDDHSITDNLPETEIESVEDNFNIEAQNEISDIFSSSAIASSKSETTGDGELEYSNSEETCVSISEQVFDDNKHDLDLISQHDQFHIVEDDVSRRGRTSSSSSTHSSKSDRSEKKSVLKSSELNCIEAVKISSSLKTESVKKEQVTKKTTAKAETNGYSSHNGIDGDVSLKNSKNVENGMKNTESEKLDSLASVTDLKTSFTKSSDLIPNEFQEEIKPSVDRVKVQRTFNQTNQDELCLCKMCGKHVYQMEKMKAVKSVFHKNCFRCKECNKLLTVDSYSSNEGDIYCKPHFRQLFQPKARFDGEDAAPRKQRRNEMIIRENIPAELPPDVIRSDSKPDHGLDNIPVNLSSIKSKFEEYREEHHLPSTTDVCTLQRSASVMARLAKYQSAVSGSENDNGELSESENEEECSEDLTVIKSSKHKEKVVFSGMSNLKSQWETGSVAATKEERMEEKKEELNKLRQRICLGRSESMKAVYEKACQDTSKTAASRTEPVDLGQEVKAIRIKEKYEKGEFVNEVEEENLEKARREKEEDLSVFSEPGIANDAKKLFKQIDATVKTTAPVLSKSPVKSPQTERQIGFHSPVTDGDVVKCSEPNEKEDIPVDTTDLSQRFKFFENYSESPKERKRFQITPPREPVKDDTPDKEICNDSAVIRGVDDIPATDTARRMLDKFKALEKETPSVPSGPKPLKRITPPREYTKVDEVHDSSPEPERDPNIIRSSYKADEDIVVEADKAKSLRAKFENWDTELRDNKRNEDDEEEDFLPQVDTTKTLRAKFESIKEETSKPTEKPKPKVNRFIQEQATTNTDICSMCGKKVYPMEKMETSGMRIHKNCFRCAHCSCMLRLENYTKSGRNLYCTPHFKQLFISRGNYDEGFGREQHKEKWNRNLSTAPLSQENENNDYSNGETQCLEQAL